MSQANCFQLRTEQPAEVTPIAFPAMPRESMASPTRRWTMPWPHPEQYG